MGNKYVGIQMPGGVMLNGQQLKDEASLEISNIEQEIKDEMQMPPVMQVG